jgi:hypothetical protein
MSAAQFIPQMRMSPASEWLDFTDAAKEVHDASIALAIYRKHHGWSDIDPRGDALEDRLYYAKRAYAEAGKRAGIDVAVLGAL